MITNNAPRLPKMPSLPKSRTQVRCACGCKTLCGNRFAPGHDSKLKGMRLRVEAGVWTEARREDGTIDPIQQLDAIAESFGPSYAEATAIEMKIEWTIEGWSERAA